MSHKHITVRVLLGTGFTSQMIQPTVSKHWRKTGI